MIRIQNNCIEINYINTYVKTNEFIKSIEIIDFF